MSFMLTLAELDALEYALAVAGTHVARDIRKDKKKGRESDAREYEELRQSEELLRNIGSAENKVKEAIQELQQTLVVQATVAPLDPSRPAQ